MVELGVDVFRFEAPWREIEPKRRELRWDRLDTMVEVLEAAGIDPVPVLVFAPDWAMQDGATTPASPHSLPDYFAHFAAAAAARYLGRVRRWELWNEPDHPHSWTGNLEQYVRLVLEPGARAIRSVDPGASILLAGLADHRNLERLHRAGAAGHYDVAGIHVYPSTSRVRQVRGAVSEARATLRRLGQRGIPLWLTECGLATRPPTSPSTFGGSSDEDGQARFVRAILTQVDADAVLVYQLADTAIYDAGGRCLKEVAWGLVSNDLTHRKPSFAEFRRSGGRRALARLDQAPELAAAAQL
jgi:hypothetical protein